MKKDIKIKRNQYLLKEQYNKLTKKENNKSCFIILLQYFTCYLSLFLYMYM